MTPKAPATEAQPPFPRFRRSIASVAPGAKPRAGRLSPRQLSRESIGDSAVLARSRLGLFSTARTGALQ